MLVVSEGEAVSFTIPDVPVLDDPNTFNQPIIMQYSGGGCLCGVDFAFPVAPVNNGVVDLGTVHFFATNCIGSIVDYHPYNLSWKRDGSEIGFDILGLWKISAGAVNEFQISKLEPDGGPLSSNMAWSPVDDRYLYIDLTGGLALINRINLAEEGGETKPLVEREGSYDVTPAWLPDGSGFVYVGQPRYADFDDAIYQYNLASGQAERLTFFKDLLIDGVSVSPDGRHVVFELADEISDPKRNDLWIMDRLNPAEIWPITSSGNCSTPDWSRKDVVLDNNNTDDNDGNNTNNHDDGGGSGCFISIAIPHQSGLFFSDSFCNLPVHQDLIHGFFSISSLIAESNV